MYTLYDEEIDNLILSLNSDKIHIFISLFVVKNTRTFCLKVKRNDITINLRISETYGLCEQTVYRTEDDKISLKKI